MAVPAPVRGADPVRRLCAFAVDYGVIAAWLALLTVAMIAFGGGAVVEMETAADRWRAHGLAFAAVTAPVALGFALFEASAMAATPGKRLTGLRVVRLDGSRAGPPATLLRNVVKFLPWEIAHAGVWHMPGRPFIDPPGVLSLVLWGAALGLALVYVVAVLAGARRTPYDRVSGLVVVSRAGAAPGLPARPDASDNRA